jgi:hypothetical protein
MPSDRAIINGVQHIITTTAGTPELPIAQPIGDDGLPLASVSDESQNHGADPAASGQE